jgi:hypothetical protein
MVEWCNLAIKSMPLLKFQGESFGIWMSESPEHIASVFKELEEGGKAYTKSYQLKLNLVLRKIDPSDIINSIAEYSITYGKDVRIVWSDDEGQAEGCRSRGMK